ncbi:chemotaxis protein CheW [Skermanella mucosa]|uniref:chemotaxis protein CheW n=1 Tax=Skermanella mucosa TaxID=1789672 RepID=UPI00192BB5A6|nr:chemotaxis protein CheW [Skermanella mucosa]UEM23696.1 chemotaxis protein CheW [Skermanella mucosa]
MSPLPSVQAPAPAPAVPESPDRRPHLVFRIGDMRAALPLREVREIVRRPDVLDVPLSPPTVEGLINLRGTVTVLLNMQRMLGQPVNLPDDGGRVVVLDAGTRVGLQVDQVAGILDLAHGQMERADIAEERDLFSGTVPGDGEEPAISVLALDRVLRRVSASVGRPAPPLAGRTAPAGTAAAARPMPEPASGTAAATRMLVSFESGGEEYALPVSAVDEVVRTQARTMRMPHADDTLLGVVTVRGRLIPLFDLATLLELGPARPGIGEADAARIIVLSFGGLRAGLLVDRAREILRVPAGQIDPVPPLFRRDGGEIEGICRLDRGRRLVSVLDPERLFRSEEARRGLAAQSDHPDADTPEEGMADRGADTESFVIFRLGTVEYGLPSSCVEQVAAVPDQLTPVPKAPDFIEGVINHRGSVLPVIDQRRRFALSGAAPARSRRIIVTRMGANRAGILVDAVTGLLRIPIAAIEPAPDLSAEQITLISRVANLGDRMILLLEPGHLLARDEADLLSDLDGTAPVRAAV